MRIRNILIVIPILTSLCACQSEVPQGESTPHKEFTIKASLPESDFTRSEFAFGNAEHNTRAQITYGNQDHRYELFLWNFEDEINVFNLSKLSECPQGLKMFATTINGSSAEFTVAPENYQYDQNYKNFRVEEGDVIFVNYNETLRASSNDDSLAGIDLFKIEIYNKPQLIVDQPNDESMSYMAESSIKMYDIVTAKDGEIPNLHFKHLSAIMRVTLRNETDSEDTNGEFWPKELQFNYPETESFFNGYIYCSVDSESDESMGLKVYPNLNGSDTYTDCVKSDINNYTAAATEKGTFLKKGQSYDLYLTCVPRIANNAKGDKLIISLQKRLGSDTFKTYSMTLDGFDVPIEAGKRYWFNLTAIDDEATGEGKLVFTNQWLKDHPEKNPENGEETPSADE